MPVDGVEVDEIREDQARGRSSTSARFDLVHAVRRRWWCGRRASCRGRRTDPRSCRSRRTGCPASFSRSSSVGANGVSAKSRRLAVRLKAPGRADERPRDHPADAEAEPDQLEGDLADAIQLGHRDDVFVRGDLKHAVGRRVDDRPAGAHVLGAELVDDRRAGRGLVAERAAADAPLELGDHLRRESRRETPETAARARAPSAPSARSPSPCRATLPPSGRTRPRGAGSALDADRRRHASQAERAQRRQRAADRAARCCRACRCPRSP